MAYYLFLILSLLHFHMKTLELADEEIVVEELEGNTYHIALVIENQKINVMIKTQYGEIWNAETGNIKETPEWLTKIHFFDKNGNPLKSIKQNFELKKIIIAQIQKDKNIRIFINREAALAVELT